MPKARQLYKEVYFVSQFWSARLRPASGLSAESHACSGYLMGEKESLPVSLLASPKKQPMFSPESSIL